MRILPPFFALIVCGLKVIQWSTMLYRQAILTSDSHLTPPATQPGKTMQECCVVKIVKRGFAEIIPSTKAP